jgi:hypothetical protein
MAITLNIPRATTSGLTLSPSLNMGVSSVTPALTGYSGPFVGPPSPTVAPQVTTAPTLVYQPAPVAPTPAVAPILPAPVAPVTVAPAPTQPLEPTPLTTTGTSQIDPTIAPYLSEALGVARNLFLQGQGPQLYPGQMYVSPSAQTMEALRQAEQIALSPEAQALSTQGLQAYQGALGGLSSIAAGDYLQSPEYQRYLESVTRPVTEAVTEQILPAIASQYSAAGRYGSGAMAGATGMATERGARALGDITSQVAQQQQARMLEAQTALPSFLGSMPQVLGGALAPSTALAGIGAQREAIAGQPLQEAIARFEYGQQLPYSQLSGYLSSIYGSPLGSLTQGQQLQGNTTLQNIGGLLSTAAAVPSAVRGIQSLGNLFF